MHTDEHVRKAKDIYGYAYGYKSICNYFGNFQYRGKTLDLVQNTPESQVQMFYMEPEWHHYATGKSLRQPGFKKFYKHQYKIYGTHLESTQVWPHWYDAMNEVDEIWVGNQFAADAVINSNIKTPVYVFEHGIDDMWQPRKRGMGNKIKFLHVDSASPRKRADLVEKAFIMAFGDNSDVELTLKYHSYDSSNEFGVMSLFNKLGKPIGNIKKIYKTLSQEEIVELYYEHDVLLYPTEGEGFGFIPLQALATGMPVISTSRWCSYDKFFKDNIIESRLGPTSHTGYLYGDVVLADIESMIELMRKVYKDIDSQCSFYYKQAPKVHKEYNWQYRCDSMLKSFIKRVGIDMLNQAENFEDKGYYIKYIGNGRYSSPTIDDTRYTFDKENRIQYVNEKIYSNLMHQSIFSVPDEGEIKQFRNKN